MTLSIFAYMAILFFIIAVIIRAKRIAATPAHLRWELYPVPHERGDKAKYGGSYLEELDWWTKPIGGSKIGELGVMIPEILLLKGVWEHNRGLWFWSWSFHMGLYAAIGMVFLLILAAIIGPATAIGKLAVDIGGIICIVGYVLGALGCLGMLVKRLADRKLKMFTTTASIFNLLFILAIFLTGIVAIQKTNPGFVNQLQTFISGLIKFDHYTPQEAAVSWHIIVALLFIIYLPLTHMVHFVAKYFTYHDVRWNDEPNFKDSAIEKDIHKSLEYKPTWAAKHINADGRKNWVDIATEEVGTDEEA